MCVQKSTVCQNCNTFPHNLPNFVIPMNLKLILLRTFFFLLISTDIFSSSLNYNLARFTANLSHRVVFHHQKKREMPIVPLVCLIYFFMIAIQFPLELIGFLWWVCRGNWHWIQIKTQIISMNDIHIKMETYFFSSSFSCVYNNNVCVCWFHYHALESVFKSTLIIWLLLSMNQPTPAFTWCSLLPTLL